MKNHKDILVELSKLKNKEKAKFLSKYFKTGKGEYGEGDIFLGISVPNQRKIALKFLDIDFVSIKKLLKSKIHEHRFTALEILVFKYSKEKNILESKKMVDFYLKNLDFVNNWDLVDTSASYILGDFLVKNKKEIKILYELLKDKNFWKRRVAIVSTYAFIKEDVFTHTIKISKSLLRDKENLIHKACGWMLREVGKRDKKVLVNFLDENCRKMPSVMKSYALEKFSKEEKKKYR